MNLLLRLPTGPLLESSTEKVTLRGLHGNFAILPRHADAVAVILPGVMTYVAQGQENHVAVDHGLLCKVGRDLTLFTRRAIQGTHLESLTRELAKFQKSQDESERRTRSALASLESRITRGLSKLELNRGG